MKKSEQMVDALVTLGYSEEHSENILFRKFRCKHVRDRFLYVNKRGNLWQGKEIETSTKVAEQNAELFIRKARYVKIGQPC